VLLKTAAVFNNRAGRAAAGTHCRLRTCGVCSASYLPVTHGRHECGVATAGDSSQPTAAEGVSQPAGGARTRVSSFCVVPERQDVLACREVVLSETARGGDFCQLGGAFVSVGRSNRTHRHLQPVHDGEWHGIPHAFNRSHADAIPEHALPGHTRTHGPPAPRTTQSDRQASWGQPTICGAPRQVARTEIPKEVSSRGSCWTALHPMGQCTRALGSWSKKSPAAQFLTGCGLPRRQLEWTCLRPTAPTECLPQIRGAGSSFQRVRHVLRLAICTNDIDTRLRGLPCSRQPARHNVGCYTYM
jgi:hypothetical protein